MAGESGRGFAVVADEVQRLAERSANATKQIDALVKTIQADTNEAVSSMETSTTGVVNGAKLAEDAGEALQRSEQVSQDIASATEAIAGQLQAQGIGVFFTIDAGPQVKAVCLPEAAARVEAALRATEGVRDVMISGLGEGARTEPLA